MLSFTIYTVTIVGIWFAQAVSLNLQYGLAGLANFGSVLFFGVGAYASAIAFAHGLPVWAGVGGGLVIAAVLSVIFAIPARNRTEDYWALLTLGGAEMVRLLLVNDDRIAGGVVGAPLSPINSETTAMILAIGLAVLAFAVGGWISRAPLGRLLRVVREDPSLAASLGKSPFRQQVKIMMLSAALAALAGSLYGHFLAYVSPDMMLVGNTVLIWVLVMVGGAGSTRGVLLGTVVVMVLYSGSTFLPQWTEISAELVSNLRIALIGVLLTAMIVLRPQGLIPERSA